jgi:hypothetical protein
MHHEIFTASIVKTCIFAIVIYAIMQVMFGKSAINRPTHFRFSFEKVHRKAKFS